MDAYADTQWITVAQIQAERRADAISNCAAAEWRRGRQARSRARQAAPWLRRPVGTARFAAYGRTAGTTR